MSALAIVTGGSSGIGRATALALADAGLEVIAVGRRESPLLQLASTSRARPVVADVTTAEGVQAVVRAAGDRAIAALVHGAGIFPRGRLESLGMDAWRAAMSTNVDARLHLVLALRVSLRAGRVLFVGSDAATRPRSGGAAYSVSKAASEMLWRCLATEMGEEIAFGLAKPGLVATAMLDESLAAPRESFPAGAVYEEMQRRGETIAPETVARFFRWLLLDTERDEFVRDAWDIRDSLHHARWLSGSLYQGPPAPRRP